MGGGSCNPVFWLFSLGQRVCDVHHEGCAVWGFFCIVFTLDDGTERRNKSKRGQAAFCGDKSGIGRCLDDLVSE